MRAVHTVAILAVAASTIACSTQGDDEGIAYSGSQLSDYAASWDGYVEAWQFESGADRVRLVLDANGQGAIELGDVAPLAPPTDPDVGYPPGSDDALMHGGVGPMEGFQYPVYGATVEEQRIRLGADPHDLVRDWCQMQTPILDEVNTTEPHYACVPNWGTMWSDAGCAIMDPQTEESVPIDCGKLALCGMGGVCECTASGCDAPVPSGTYPMQLDAALQGGGDDLVGTLVLDGQTRLTVRLNRL